MAIVRSLLYICILALGLAQQTNLLEEVTLNIPDIESITMEDFPSPISPVPTMMPPRLISMPGSTLPTNCSSYCGFNTITATGDGSVEGTPDTASINLELRATAETKNEAVNLLAGKVTESLSLLGENGLSSADWETLYINVYPNSSFIDGRRVEFGQIASQGLKINILISDQGASIGRVYDSLAQVDGVSITRLAYDLKDKSHLMKEARQKAYRNAEKKVKDYLSAVNLRVKQVIAIEDNYSEASTVPVQLQRQALALADGQVSTPTSVSVGEITVGYKVRAVFEWGNDF